MREAALWRERRREALVLSAELQRRNVAVRWQALAARRSMRWIDATWSAAAASRRAAGGGLPWAALARGGAGWLTARPAGGSLAAVVGLLRRPSWWSLGALAARWLWQRRRQRSPPIGRARRLLHPAWLADR